MIHSISQLQAECEAWADEVSEESGDVRPADGWHTLTVGTGREEPDPGSLATWARLFSLYAENRSGTLYWHTVPHWDREKREIAAKFCIQ